MTRLVALCLVSTLLWASTATSQVRRFAVVVGNDVGDDDEAPLQYAERDARRVADVLAKRAGVAAEDLTLLLGPTADRVTAALSGVAERIRIADEALLYVYYSGHAGPGSLHLSGTRLPLSALTTGAADAGAKVAIVIVDACRSGTLVQLKGGVVDEPFEIRAEDRLESSGLAIIASSAATEDAQESKRLRGGIFTHHLITGLIGAADATADRRVTLNELYRYVYAQTIRTTTATKFVQHPAYKFALEGRQDVVVTTLEDDEAGRLALERAGSYVILRDDAVVAELEARADTAVLLTPGDYLVRRRQAGRVDEAAVTVSRGATTTVGRRAMRRLTSGQIARRGQGDAGWGVGLGSELSGPVLGTDLTAFGLLSGRVELPVVTLQLRARYGRASVSPDAAVTAQETLGADLAAVRLFDVHHRLGLGPGVRLGIDWIRQRVRDRPDRDQAVGRVAGLLRVEAVLLPALVLTLDGGADLMIVEQQADPAAASEIRAEVTPFGSLGLTVLFD